MPLDSTMVINITTVIEAAASKSNRGRPKCKGEIRLNQPAFTTPVRSTRPEAQAQTKPMAMPMRTAVFARKPLANRVTPRMIAMTRTAMPTPQSSPGAPPGPPPAIQFTATPMSDTPISNIAVPVTTGANRRESRLIQGAISRPSTPDTMVAPKTPGSPSDGSAPMAMLGPTDTKVTPMMTGRRTPTKPRPMHWINVTSPQATRSELTR